MGSQERRNGKRKRKAGAWSSQVKDLNRYLISSEDTPGEVREWAKQWHAWDRERRSQEELVRSLVDDNPYEAAMEALYQAATEEQKARKAWGKGLLEALNWSDREADMSDERRWDAMHFVFGFFVFDQGMRGMAEGPRAVVDAVYGTIASYPLLVIAAWERMRSAEWVKDLSYAVVGYLRTKLTTTGNRGTRLREAERTLRTLRADAALEAALLNTIAPAWEETKAAMSEAIKETPVSEAWEQVKEQATKDLRNASARHFEKAMEPFRLVKSECDDTGQPVLSLDYQYDLEADDALSSTTLHNTPDPTAPDPQLTLIRKERPEEIRQAVRTLSSKQRKFAELMLAGYDSKKDRAEMGKKLGVKKNQVSSLKGDVRKSLAPKLAGAAGNRKHSTCRIQPRENGKPHKHGKKELYAVYDEGWDAYRKPYVTKGGDRA